VFSFKCVNPFIIVGELIGELLGYGYLNTPHEPVGVAHVRVEYFILSVNMKSNPALVDKLLQAR